MIKYEVFSSIIQQSGPLISKLESEYFPILESLMISLNKLELMEDYALDELVNKISRYI